MVGGLVGESWAGRGVVLRVPDLCGPYGRAGRWRWGGVGLGPTNPRLLEDDYRISIVIVVVVLIYLLSAECPLLLPPPLV